MPDRSHVLVATLGGQPQVVTLTLDLLLKKGFPINEVIVLHPGANAPSRLYNALVRLDNEFTNGPYAGIRFHSQPLKLDGALIDDITDDVHADGTLDTIHHLLSDLKQKGYHIHLSVSGGRRLMALLAISVAMLNFDRHDRIWHLYTPEEVLAVVKEGQMLHMRPEAGVQLIQGPFLSLGAYISNPAQPFRQVQQQQRTQMDAQEREACQKVINRATPGQRRVLKAFARGQRPQQVAEELVLSLKTVDSHKSALLEYCHEAWNIPLQERLSYHFLNTKFANAFPDDNDN